MQMRGNYTAAFVLLGTIAAGCRGGGSTQDSDAGDTGTYDASVDAAADAGDAGVDAAAADAGSDAGDAGTDAGDAGEPPICAGEPVGTPCRPAVGACDVTEVCDGVSDTCPPDSFAPPTTACDDGTFCNGAEMCDGAGACVSPGDPCAGADGDANCSETCDESADACTAADPDDSACAERACEEASCQAGACVVTAMCPVFVDPSGSDGEGCGLAWGDAACSSVQGGSDEAVRIDADRVWVREASYTASDPSEPLLSMATGVAYYGGFAGTELEEDDREEEGRATLDGEGVVAQVVVGASDARLDGFRITGGHGNQGSAMYNDSVSSLTVDHCDFVANTLEANGSEEAIGGIFNLECANLTFSHVTLRSNSATATAEDTTALGAGMANDSSTGIQLLGVLFIDNAAEGAGSNGGAFGGALLNSASSVTLRDVLFESNTVAADFANGAAMANYGSTLTLDDVQLIDNRITSLDDGPNNGGGMFDDGTQSTLTDVLFQGNGGNVVNGGGYAVVGAAPAGGVTTTMRNVSFTGNQVTGAGGGALFIDAAGTSLSATLEGGLFDGNTVVGEGGFQAFGGALASVDANVAISACEFRNNSVEGTDAVGGALQVFGGSLSLTDVDLLDNTSSATDSAGGLAVSGGAAVDALDANLTLTNVSMGNNVASGTNALGGALLVEGSSEVEVLSSTFAVNTATSGGAISLVGAAQATLDNVVLGGNTPADLDDPLGGVTTGHLCAEGNAGPGAAFTDYTHALTQGPQGRWYLTAASACVDSGDDAKADAAFGGNTWQTLTTQLDGTLDTGTVDIGRHYGP